ncbi:MAG TPA: DUF2975 domain-containing protein [Steroidobacteraceae bacterium]|nr:DUF2975 domain-containing protein [Steroidobacteraceae bacterium]
MPGHSAASNLSAEGPDLRLKLQSLLLSRLFLVLAIVAAIEVVFAIGSMLFRFGSFAGMQDGAFAFVLPIPPLDEALDTHFTPASSLPVWESTLAAVLLAARLSPGLFILWQLHILFLLYSRGRVFTRDNARQVRVIACALLIYAAIPLFTHGALFLAHMASTPIKMEIRQMDALVLGLVLFPIARVMTFGHEIECDREGFI